MKTSISETFGGLVRRILSAAAVLCCVAVGGALQSCGDDDGAFPVFPLNRPNALVTVKPSADGSSFCMQLDDSTRVTATNIRQAPYGGKEVRAFVNMRLYDQPAGRRQYDVYVNWIDSILTKPMAASAGLLNNERYGDDPVELLRDWTVAEDGYLTIHFRTQWAASGTPHIVNLVHTGGIDPYDLTFHHNAQGVKGGYWGDGIVAFRLDRLPDTKGRTVNIKLRWKSFGGERSVDFKYCTRRSSGVIGGLSSAASGQFEKSLK